MLETKTITQIRNATDLKDAVTDLNKKGYSWFGQKNIDITQLLIAAIVSGCLPKAVEVNENEKTYHFMFF